MRWLMLLLLVSWGSSLRAQEEGAQPPRILLRNLQRLTTFEVVGLDEDGIRLKASGGEQQLTWDQIQAIRLADAEQQKTAQGFLQSVGEPLFRLRARLAANDLVGAAEPAEKLFPAFQERKGEAAKLVLQGTYLSRMAACQREQAIAPYLLWLSQGTPAAVAASDGAADAKGASSSDKIGSDLDANGGLLLPSLLPVAFDSEAAKKALPDLQNAIRQIPLPRHPASYIYFASMAVAAGDAAQAKKVLAALPAENAPWLGWKKLVALQVELAEAGAVPELAKLEKELAGGPPLLRAAFLFSLSQTRDEPNETEQRELQADLATLGMVYQLNAPEVAAMALSQLADSLRRQGHTRQAAAVLAELETRYAESYAARRQRLLATTAGKEGAAKAVP